MEEDTSQTLTTTANNKVPNTKSTSTTANGNSLRGGNRRVRGHGDNEDGEEKCDVEAWETLSKSFRQVQTVLDQNRALIQQVNENHKSKVHDNLVKNVGLIREINGNISKVMGLYSDLSVNFTNIVHQRRALTSNCNANDDSGGDVEKKDCSEA